MNAPASIIPPYRHTPLFPLGKDSTPYRKLGSEGGRIETVMGKEMLVVEREALRALAEAAYGDINHLLRPGHLAQLPRVVRVAGGDADGDAGGVEEGGVVLAGAEGVEGAGLLQRSRTPFVKSDNLGKTLAE